MAEKGIHVNKDWGKPEKVKARSESVFDMYRKLTGKQSLVVPKQYWSLCGLHMNDRCELPHALQDGVISSESQYRGVDCRRDVIEHNRQFYPDVWWSNDDFVDAMESADNFNPGLVNFDSVSMVENACKVASQILYLLIERDIDDVFVVVNFLLNNPRRRTELCNHPDDFFESVNSFPMCRYVFSMGLDSGWVFHPMSYVYNGADFSSNSFLQTVYFYRSSK